LTDLALGKRAALFQGKDHGSGVSFFVTAHERGEGPRLHRHPYDETFLVEDGAAVFTVGDETVEARAGQVLVVPTGVVHGFKGASDEPVKLVSIHPRPEVQTEWLE
jgi:quercetin dioxygenase-like cupin family protein